MARRYAAERVLEILQNLSSMESEQLETDNVSDTEIETNSFESSSHSEDDIIVPRRTRENGRPRGCGRDRTKTTNTPTD